MVVSPDAAACDQRSGTSLRLPMRLSVRMPLMWSTISSLVSFLPRCLAITARWTSSSVAS